MVRFSVDSDTNVIRRLEGENRALEMKIRESKRENNRLTTGGKRVKVVD